MNTEVFGKICYNKFGIVRYYEFNEGINNMKSIAYKKRIILSIILFLLTMLLYTYLHNSELIYLAWLVIPLIAFLNRKILGNRANLTDKEKILLVVSYIIIFVVFMFLIYSITVNKIINN